jgi:putative transcriptional regulator
MSKLQFEWDGAKAAANFAKHGIRFQSATRLFLDPDAIDVDATRVGDDEARRKIIGLSTGGFLRPCTRSRQRSPLDLRAPREQEGRKIVVRFKLDPARPPKLTAGERKRLDAMSDAEITAAALSDPDNPPLTDAELLALRTARLVKKIRTARGLSQREFAARYCIPVGNVRDWEQGRSVPDKTARAYLSVIAKAPDAVEEALAK